MRTISTALLIHSCEWEKHSKERSMDHKISVYVQIKFVQATLIMVFPKYWTGDS